MSAKTITVVATFQARPGKEAELKNALIGLVAPTRKEAGGINYDLHASPDDPVKFLFKENWARKQHFDTHLQSAHIKALLPRVDELWVAFPEIKIWDKIV